MARKILQQNFDQDAAGGLVWCGNMNWKILQAMFRTAWLGGVIEFWNLLKLQVIIVFDQDAAGGLVRRGNWTSKSYQNYKSLLSLTKTP